MNVWQRAQQQLEMGDILGIEIYKAIFYIYIYILAWKSYFILKCNDTVFWRLLSRILC